MAYDDDFKVKSDKREMGVNNLVNNVFKASREQFGKLATLREAGLVVERLDKDLETAWKDLGAVKQIKLRLVAKEFYQGFNQNQQKYFDAVKEDGSNPYLSEVRRAILGRRRFSPYDLFLQSERKRGEEMAKSIGVGVEELALAMCSVKYKELCDNKRQEHNNFPWNVAVKEQ